MGKNLSRRRFVTAIGATGAAGVLGACSSGAVGSRESGAQLDAKVDATRDYLFKVYPGTRALAQKASGVLYVPLITQVGLIYGGSYGRGALRIGDVSVDYYSVASASLGLQVGVQQYAHALFFMTPTALADFRRSSGWALGGNVTYAVSDSGGTLATDTLETKPIVAIVFGQQGLIVGAVLNGTKYTRIIP